MRRDVAGWAAARCVGAWVQQQVASLECATELQQVLDGLQIVLNVYVYKNSDQKQQKQQLQQHGLESDDRLQQALLQHATAHGWSALQRCFYEEQYQTWATSVLTVAAGDWLVKDSGDSLRSLISDAFQGSPAAVALAALVGHLSAVLSKHSNSSTAVTAVAAGTAAELLAQRFATPGSCGVHQLLESCDAAPAAAQHSYSSCASQQQHTKLLSSWPFMQPLSSEQRDEAAQQLASAPDRAQQLPEVPSLLQPAHFVQFVLQQAIEYLINSTSCDSACGNSSSHAGSTAISSAGDSCTSSGNETHSTQPAICNAVSFTARLLQKFVTRGYAQHAAAALLQLLHGQQEQQQRLIYVTQLVLLEFSNHTAAAEKLLVQLLSQASRQQHKIGKNQQSLTVLLCPVLAVNANMRTVALQKLLLRRTLPCASLAMLLTVLDGVRPSLIPEAAADLARSWSDQHTMSSVSVSQQAYMTAALGMCIDMLPRAVLDPTTAPSTAAATGGNTLDSSTAAHLLNSSPAAAAVLKPYKGVDQQHLASLIPSILQGVSMRLASPSPSIRAQAMRVGRGFAVKLDPAKPLFEDAGDLALLPDEIWPGALAAAPQQLLHGGQLSEAAAAAPAGGDSSSSNYQALQRLHAAALESDSDDEDQTTSLAAAVTDTRQQIADGTIRNSGGSTAAYIADDAASDAGSESSASSLVAFDLQEDAAAEEWWGPDSLGLPEGKPMGLRAVAAALRKHDDVTAVLDALSRVEVLVRAAPDELPVVGPELARSLLHCKIPVWAATPGTDTPAYQNHEPSPGQDVGLNPNAEVQRQRALTAVLSLSPLTVGDTMITELYSPHLDQYQRMLILDSLAAAAVEMSDPRKAPRLAAAAPGQAPKLLPSLAAEKKAAKAALPTSKSLKKGFLTSSTAGKASRAAVSTAGNAAASTAAAVNTPTPAAPGMVAASTRVWGKVSLQKQAAAASQCQAGREVSSAQDIRTFRNRFAPVAVRWASLLLKECDVRKHGVDLFGRDSLLLGRLLTVMGTFVECAAATPAAVPLSAGLLELIKAPQVSAHKEVFVRRSALAAAAQVVRHLPPARLAGALIGRQQDVQDAVLVERLQWLMGWAQAETSSDVDEHCRVLAAGCVAWHVELAESAMAALEHLPDTQGPSLTGVKSSKSIKSAAEGLEIKVPKLQERLVLQ